MNDVIYYTISHRKRNSANVTVDIIITLRHLLAGRISIVNYGGEVMMDTFVRPTFDITTYRTQWSGLTAEMLKNAPKFDYVRQSVMHMLKVVLRNDLKS